MRDKHVDQAFFTGVKTSYRGRSQKSLSYDSDLSFVVLSRTTVHTHTYSMSVVVKFLGGMGLGDIGLKISLSGV